MASQALTAISVPFCSSVTVTFTALSATSLSFTNDGKTLAILKNASATPVNVTLQTVADEYGRTANTAVAIAAGAERVFAPVRPLVFNQRTGADIGKCIITAASTPSMSCAILALTI